MAKELQKPFNLPSVPLWKKFTLKRIIIAIIISLLFAMGQSAKTFFDKRWEEEGHAYDVKAEYFVFTFTGGGERILIKNGWDPEGMIPTFLHHLEAISYKSAMKKIPVNDGERVIWYFGHKILPQIAASNTSKEFVLDIRKTFLKLSKQPVASLELQKIYKPNILATLFNYTIVHQQDFKLDDNEISILQSEMLEKSIEILNRLDVQAILSNPRFAIMPIRYSFSVLTASFERLKNSDFSCNQQNIQYYIDAKKALTHIASQYQQAQKQLDNAQLQEMMQIAYSARDTNVTLREALLDKCKLDIQALEQQ